MYLLWARRAYTVEKNNNNNNKTKQKQETKLRLHYIYNVDPVLFLIIDKKTKNKTKQNKTIEFIFLPHAQLKK